MTKRAPPDIKPEDLIRKIDEKEKKVEAGWQSYHCKLVTPMYGGGVKAGEVDREMPIRTSEIRGQLRFWWRLVNRDRFIKEGRLNSRAMFDAEQMIWGGIGEGEPMASKIELKVVCPKVSDTDLILSSDEKNLAIKYAFGSASINGAVDWLKPGYEFELYLRVPASIAEDVQLALRWWASFGGIGARTRRGFGALQVSNLATVIASEVASYKGRLMVSGSGSNKPDSEWKASIDRLFSFRQKGGIGRTERKPTPGRSFWPEPDQIRRFTNKNANGKHEPVHEAGNVFPRAAFGLPITFEFKGSPGEPKTMELHPKGDSDRMASPLILRPYWNGSTWQPAALLIPGWEAALEQPLKFKGQNYQPAQWPKDIEKRKEIAAKIIPMKNSKTPDPLSAFMEFFERGQ